MSEKKNYNKNTKSDMQWKCKESKTTFPKKKEKQNEIFQQNTPSSCAPNAYRDQLFGIMSWKCINLDTFYYVIFVRFTISTIYTHVKRIDRFSYSINFFDEKKKRGRSKLCWCIQIKNKLNVTWIEIAHKRGWEWGKKRKKYNTQDFT